MESVNLNKSNKNYRKNENNPIKICTINIEKTPIRCNLRKTKTKSIEKIKKVFSSLEEDSEDDLPLSGIRNSKKESDITSTSNTFRYNLSNGNRAKPIIVRLTRSNKSDTNESQDESYEISPSTITDGEFNIENEKSTRTNKNKIMDSLDSDSHDDEPLKISTKKVTKKLSKFPISSFKKFQIIESSDSDENVPLNHVRMKSLKESSKVAYNEAKNLKKTKLKQLYHKKTTGNLFSKKFKILLKRLSLIEIKKIIKESITRSEISKNGQTISKTDMTKNIRRTRITNGLS